jgi:hypothetical protein
MAYSASPGSDDDPMGVANLYRGVVELFDEGDFAATVLEDAIAKFESGDYIGAESSAHEAMGSPQFGQQSPSLPDEQLTQRLGSFEVDNKLDKWRMALDRLTSTYGDMGEADQAEAIFLRMLAWREGIQQQQQGGHSLLSSSLFQKSTEFSSIDDATWFLSTLKPDDGHAVTDVLPLLALGEQVAAKAAVAIWTLALRAKHRPQITDNGGLELLAKAVSQYPSNAELAAAGCGALRQLCQGHQSAVQNRRTLTTKLEGVQIITSVMRQHRMDVEVQRESCGALGVLASENPLGLEKVLAREGIQLCLEAMVCCPDVGVGDAACKALATFCGRSASSMPGVKSSDAATAITSLQDGGASSGGSASVDVRVNLRSECERGLRFCLRQLEAQLSTQERLQMQELRTVLQYLLWSTMIFLDDSGMRHLAMHVVQFVVSCMCMFPGCPQIQVPACGIIWRLTVGHQARDEAVQKVAMAGGIAPICQAMKDLPCQRDLQQVAIGALRNVAFGNDANKTLVVRAGGLPATIEAMKRYPKYADLQEQAIGALTSLCDTVGRAALCARLGGTDTIITALRRHSSVGHIAELGCIVLCMFCDDQQLKHLIVRSGALQIAKTLSRAENSEARQWGCELLRDLSDK